MKSIALTFTLLFGIAFNILHAQSLTIDASKAKVSFKVPAEDVTGTVTGMKATIKFDPENLGASTIKGSIDATTLTTGSKMRDGHLQKDEFFDTQKYPRMSFESTKIEKTEKGYKMTGNLTIKNVTKPVTISFTFSDNLFLGKMIIYTNDFNLNIQKKKEDSKVLVKLTVPVS